MPERFGSGAFHLRRYTIVLLPLTYLLRTISPEVRHITVTLHYVTLQFQSRHNSHTGLWCSVRSYEFQLCR